MSLRCSAISELTRIWLEQRHGCVVRESLPVPVPRALSGIDLVAVRADGAKITLPNSATVGPRLIVEAKDEHDWEPTGKEFGQALRADLVRMSPAGWIPPEATDVKFSMLREQHFRRAENVFGTADFDRLFVVHAIDANVLHEHERPLTAGRIYWLTIREVVADLLAWYDGHPRPAERRSDLVSDMFHLLVGFCHFRPKQI